MRIAILVAASLALPLAALEQHFVGPKVARTSITVIENVAYRKGGDEPLRFNVYRPKNEAVVPVVIFANIGNPVMKEMPGYAGWGEALAGAGVAAVQYNALQPSAVTDYGELFAALQAHAAEYRLDLSRVVIWAGSSNVLLGLPAAMDPANRYIRGAVFYYGAADVAQIRLDLPVFCARAGQDGAGLNQRIDALVARALAANAPWTFVNVAAGVHGFDVFNDDEIARDTVDRTIAFILRVTTPQAMTAYAAAAPEAATAAAFNRGDWSAAADGYRRRVAAHPDEAIAHLRLGQALSGQQQFAEALPEIERAWDLGMQGPRDTALPAAVAAAGAGNIDRAVHWLDVLLSTPFGGDPASYLTDQRFARIREEPAFRAVVDKHRVSR